jgi:gas vesicle protein
LLEDLIMDNQHVDGDSGWVNAFVFVAGFLLGAGTAILLTPESGSQLRHRLARGAKTAQEEFSDVACQTKESLNALSEEAKRTIQATKSRLHSAVDATKESVKTPGQPSSDN